MTLLTVMSQNIQYGARAEGRLEGLYETVEAVGPDLLMLQECTDLADEQARAEFTDRTGMLIELAPSRNLPVAVAWNPARLTQDDVETRYWHELHHGYCSVHFTLPSRAEPLPVPLVAISAHLTPYSANQAADEAALLAARLYRAGGIGMLAGDINHPTFDDPEPDWTRVPPYNRASRCVRRTGDEPWRSNRVVGQSLRDADLTDVAAHLADLRQDPGLRAATGKAGLIRVDQVHVTLALRPAIRDYRMVESSFSDHHGLLATFDLDAIDRDAVIDYA